jgi:hypothetical protein
LLKSQKKTIFENNTIRKQPLSKVMHQKAHKPDKSKKGEKSTENSDSSLNTNVMQSKLLDPGAQTILRKTMTSPAKNIPEAKPKTNNNKMPENVQAKMENSFSTDFSNVNIHKDDDSATQMGALAYTQGNNIHFAPGKYEPESKKGQELLGHELTHVEQQRKGKVKPMPKLADIKPQQKSKETQAKEQQHAEMWGAQFKTPEEQMQLKLKYGYTQLKSDIARTRYQNFKSSSITQLKRDNQDTRLFRSKAKQFEHVVAQRKVAYGSEAYIQLAAKYFPGHDFSVNMPEQPVQMAINDSPTLEKEADVMGKKAAEGNDVSVENSAVGVQRQEDENLPGQQNTSNEANNETVSETATTTDDEAATTADETVYYVSKSDANARVDTAPHDDYPEGKPIIPIGTKVKQVETYGSNRVKIQKWDDANQSWWTWNGNVSAVETINDNEVYTTFFDKIDTPVHDSPFVVAGDKKLEAKTKYKILEKCSDSKNGDYYKVQKDGENNPTGWIKDYQNHLFNFNREDKLAAYKKWLEERYKEASEKTGDDQISFVQGILYQAEVASENIAKDPPVYPDTETLDKNPSFNETENAAKNVTVPHDLISILRKFIEITEKKPATATTDPATQDETATTEATTNTQAEGESPTVTETTTASSQETETATNTTTASADNNTETLETAANTTTENNRIVGGSRHSNIDWNSRLGVPQYRTQSDNLVAPEVTCSVTSFAMSMERLGYGRINIIAAIETKLKEDNPQETDVTKLWETKSKEYLNKVNSTAEKDFRKIRANSGGLAGKEEALSKKFKNIAQMEDLLDFYYYLHDNTPRNRSNILGWDDKSKKLNRIADSDFKESDSEKFDNITLKSKWNQDKRNKIKAILDEGGTIVLNIKHKGTSSNGHIIVVQSINSEGLIVDDPYGKHAQDYRQGETGDLYAGKGKSVSNRKDNNEQYRNTKHFNKDETDYSKRDFTVESGQNLSSDESKGNSVLLTFKMLDESSSFIKSIYVYNKK